MHACSCINAVIICLMWREKKKVVWKWDITNSVAEFFTAARDSFPFRADFCEKDGRTSQKLPLRPRSPTLPGQQLKSNDQESLFILLTYEKYWSSAAAPSPDFLLNNLITFSSLSKFFTADTPEGTRECIRASQNGPWQINGHLIEVSICPWILCLRWQDPKQCAALAPAADLSAFQPGGH